MSFEEAKANNFGEAPVKRQRKEIPVRELDE